MQIQSKWVIFICFLVAAVTFSVSIVYIFSDDGIQEVVEVTAVRSVMHHSISEFKFLESIYSDIESGEIKNKVRNRMSNQYEEVKKIKAKILTSKISFIWKNESKGVDEFLKKYEGIYNQSTVHEDPANN